MADTLNDYLKASKDAMQKGFISDLLRYSDLMKIVPFAGHDDLQVTGSRWQSLPSVGFRKYGGGYSESTGKTEPVSETLALLGGDVKIEKIGASKNLKTQMDMKAQATAFAFNHYFVNGDHASDPDGFEGIKKRVGNMATRQTIYLDSAGNGTGDALKVLASSANRQDWLDALHAAIKRSSATHLLVNEDTFLGLGQVLRREGLLETKTDAYGHEWSAFAGIPFVDIGLKADKSTEIITNTEDPGDGGNDASSIYAVRFDTRDGLHGIYLNELGGAPKVYDPLNGKEMEGGPQYLRRIDWGVGLFSLSQYSITRVQGFKMAAS